MRAIRWSRSSRDDLAGIWDFFAVHDIGLAERAVRQVLFAVSRLGRHAYLGRPGIVAGTRELVVLKSPHVVIYEISDDTIRILRVHDGRSDWRPKTS